MDKLKLGSEVEKAFSEGVYADTPKNRKLGRVGMSYKTYSKKEEKEPTLASAGSGDDGGNKKQGKRVGKKYVSLKEIPWGKLKYHTYGVTSREFKTEQGKLIKNHSGRLGTQYRILNAKDKFFENLYLSSKEALAFANGTLTKKEIEERKKKNEEEHQKYVDRERTKYVISALTSTYGSDLKNLSEAKANAVCKYIESIAKETTGKSYLTNYKKATLEYKKERIANFYIKSGSIDKNASISENVSTMNDILSDILEGQG